MFLLSLTGLSMCLAPGFVPTRQGRYKKNIEGFVRQPARLDGSRNDFGEGTSIKCVHWFSSTLKLLVVSGFVSNLQMLLYMWLHVSFL